MLRRAGDEAGRLGQRALFLCTPGLAGSRHAARIRESLGGLWVADSTDVAPHVPIEAVEKAVAQAGRHEVDVVVALGGGSAIGLGKAVALSRSLPLVAIPTTYAGSEMTPVLGTTDTAMGLKRTVADPRILPRVVIYDVEATLELPAATTAATGINALAHCVEAVYSTSGSPLVPPVALDGAARISRALPTCVADGTDVVARTEMLVAAFLAGFSLAHAGMALHHGLCHSLGGKLAVPHGVANAIMLPHVMRYNADAAAPALASLGRAMGIETDPADGVSHLVASLGLPQRLRDVGVAETDLAGVAADAMHSSAVRANPKPITDSAQLLAVLRSAW
jgi:alcohol dehydrogenase class IV